MNLHPIFKSIVHLLKFALNLSVCIYKHISSITMLLLKIIKYIILVDAHSVLVLVLVLFYE